VSVLLQLPDGSFLHQQDLPMTYAASSVSVRRLTDGGLPDLLSRSQSGITVFQNMGNGSFAGGTNYTGAGSPIGMLVGSWSGGPTPDILSLVLSTLSLSGHLYLLPGLADGGLGGVTTSIYLLLRPWQMVTGDFRDAGRSDIAITNFADKQVTVLLDDGDGGFGPQVSYGTGKEPYGIQAGDLDRDGHVDLVVVDHGNDNITVLRGDGGGGFTDAGAYAAGGTPENALIADFNQDGAPDIVVASDGDNVVGVLWNLGPVAWKEGHGLSTRVTFGVGNNPRWIDKADFNQDGAMDVVVSNSDDGTVQILLNGCP
jgi:hypothetical protein